MSNSYSPNNSWQFIQDNFGIIVLCLIFLLGGFFVGSVWTENKNMKTYQAAVIQEDNGKVEKVEDDKASQQEILKEVPPVSDQDHVIGAENPKIYLIAYSDYECSYCQRFHTYLEEIMAEYNDQVAVVLRHFPLSFHTNAQAAAEASECVAADAGNEAFWNYTNELFAQQKELGGKLSPEAIQTAIKASGADEILVNECLDSGEMTELVSNIQTGGAKIGISGTPGTVLVSNDGQFEFISGAQPVPQLKQIIEKYL